MRTTAIAPLVSCLLLGGCAARQFAPPQQTHNTALDSVAWLAGAWVNDSGMNSIEEVWMRPLGGTMFGVNREVREGDTVFYEYLCIQDTPDGIFYLASPKGRQPPTPFQLIKVQGMSAVFENLQHDYPTRIVYRRAGNTLHGRIEGTRDGQAASEDWTWQKLK